MSNMRINGSRVENGESSSDFQFSTLKCPLPDPYSLFPNLESRFSIFGSFAALILACFVALFLPVQAAQAQAGNTSDLIAAVNAYRTSNGLEAYAVDSSLMSQAQSQSDTMSSVGYCTHLRADGSGPGDHGISAENVACGINLSVNGAIYSEWSDSVHSATILGPETGLVGAGVAQSNGSVYYTLDVKLLTGNFNYRPPKSTSDLSLAVVSGDTATPNSQPGLAGSVLTSTPNADGSITHVIQYGETLIQIVEAYGITLSQLYANNPSLDPQNPKYYEGQVLIIRPAYTPTPVVSPTNTPPPPTHTLRPTRTATRVQTATPQRTVTQTLVPPTPTPASSGPDNRTWDTGLSWSAAWGWSS